MALDTDPSHSLVLGQLGATEVQYQNAEHRREISLYKENIGFFWMGRHKKYVAAGRYDALKPSWEISRMRRTYKKMRHLHGRCGAKLCCCLY